ncbi:hypothetical protein EHQ12_16015 [Leptospira gomenensis]|uniref:VOC family protein n=1 Tax=Leptospira gomenensis TaxID=2484974 RepID=A0A5F1YC31_9LEPT|nr:hypothetical protein [Leptospira gomenensis]TGK35102.1 hypothetical protein EHQ12_16015 [Leptospira gomenensis]TGK35221.1 hypothetical protein EHQ17_07210 [Leptospira gomenensis]TGK41082.1 hypothetical protein EHQ07_16970 [Leptospira gomenensis]TGK61312.1 hypothetical protein EHQ13_09650 [Leptospira gomenensis]
MIEFYASNFQSTDCSVAASLYSEIFGFEVLRSSGTHSELNVPGSILIFSKESKHCPVSPGTITFRIEKKDWETLSSRLLGRGFLFESGDGDSYRSVLDPWENRIWFYFS